MSGSSMSKMSMSKMSMSEMSMSENGLDKNVELWYRVKEQRYASCFDDDYLQANTTIKVEVETYRVEKKTPKGVWLTTNLDPDRHDIYHARVWVNRNSRKKFACPSLEEAYKSFFLRKERQIEILKSRLNQAEEALELGKIQAEKKGL